MSVLLPSQKYPQTELPISLRSLLGERSRASEMVWKSVRQELPKVPKCQVKVSKANLSSFGWGMAGCWVLGGWVLGGSQPRFG